MMDAKIYIESSWRGPTKRDGVAMWLIEVENNGEPVTKQGYIHLEDGTELRGNLQAMINAFFVLKKWVPKVGSASVFTQCDSILNTIGNRWHIQWKKNEWRNAKGKPVKNQELWEMLIETSSAFAYAVRGGHHEYTNVMQIELQREVERWKSTKNSEKP